MRPFLFSTFKGINVMVMEVEVMALGSGNEWRKIHLGTQSLDLFQNTCGMWVTES
jgi:hypothetical protein